MSDAPDALSSELFCVAGRSEPADFEEFLVQQHEAGAVQIHDRGSVPGRDLTRWRVSWPDGEGGTVHAVVATLDGTTVWVGAHRDGRWGWGVPSPLHRLGLTGRFVVEPSAGLACTGILTYELGRSAETLLEALRDDRCTVPILVQQGAAYPTSRARLATAGSVCFAIVDDGAAQQLAAGLPETRAVPDSGARLYLPRCWRDPRRAGEHHLEDVVLAASEHDDEEAWRHLVEVALRASRWRPDSTVPADEGLWRSLLAEPWHDERLPGARWPGTREGDKSLLRQRIRGADHTVTELRELVSTRARTVARLEDEIDRSGVELDALRRSRTVLARAVLRLRAERDAAREALATTSVGVARRRESTALRRTQQHIQRLQDVEDATDRLRRRESWLGRSGEYEDSAYEDSAGAGSSVTDVLARERPGILLGRGMSSGTELDAAATLRLEQVLGLLSDHTREPRGSARKALVDGGIPADLVQTTAPGAEVTFPVPVEVDAGGWAPFPECVRLGRGVEPAVVHFLDHSDAAGTRTVHIGYVGPEIGVVE